MILDDNNNMTMRRWIFSSFLGTALLSIISCSTVSDISPLDTSTGTDVPMGEPWLEEIETLWAEQNCPSAYDWEVLGEFDTDSEFVADLAVEEQKAFDLDEQGRVCGAAFVDETVDTEGPFGFGFYHDGSEMAKFTDSYDLASNLDRAFEINGCNDHGQFAGRGAKEGVGAGAFFFSETSGVVFPYPSEIQTWARGINNNGVLVGQRGAVPSAEIEYQSGFVFDPTQSKLTELGQAPGAYGKASSDALDINDVGVVAGWAEDFYRARRPIRWSEAGGMVNLPTLGEGRGGRAHAINNHGMIAGVSHKSLFGIDDALEHPVVWDAQNHLFDLGTPTSPVEYDSGAALAINDHGLVVGYAYSSEFTRSEKRAFIWCGGIMRDLNTLINEWGSNHALEATGVNNGSEIVLTANKIGSKHPDAVIAVKLTPVSE